ncbi:type II toxin-antitoxin system VapC family toxin [Neorhodopirellula pilleata]|uniref:type II toxin-antitoxin system VapC family toxin n=1 Tax=Neorhodopirellula pilleata TaxID=2714738 RepID=UPI0018CCE4B2|nr:type II toxin-antitoxin system VapC family toxin [Neorhodopirellula pilleata]
MLDTHTLYWFIEGDAKLSTPAAAVIGEPTNTILFSPASYWEMAIKISLGKWQLNQPYSDFIDIALVNYGFEILNISPGHTAELLNLPFYHRDPFDRLLIAQAIAEGVEVVSADTQFDAYPVNRTW